MVQVISRQKKSYQNENKTRIIELLILNYIDMAKTVFSCAAASLNKHNNGNYELFKTLPKRAAYRKENISVWKLCKEYYIYCYKNIIIMSLTGLSRDFVEALVNGKEYKYGYILEMAKEDISNAEQYAKEYGFKLESI